MRGSIVKRKSGYTVVYDVGQKWSEEKAQWVRKQKWEKVKSPDTRKHAEKILAERLSQINRGEFIEPSAMTFAEYAEIWLNKYARIEVRPSTLAQYLYLFRGHIFPAIGNIQLQHLGSEELQGLKAQKLSAGLSPQTVKHIMRLVRQMLKHAVSWSYIRTNPATAVRDPKVPRQEMDFLTADEVKVLLNNCPDRYYALFLTAVTGGLRIGELLAMKWSGIDWQSGKYHVKETLTRTMETSVAGFAPVKTETSAKPIDLTPSCLEALKQHRAGQAEEKLKSGDTYIDNDLVFATSLGKPLNDRNLVNRVFHPTLADAGLRRIKFHGLRHTCASLLMDQGESPKYVQTQMRHASIKITFDTYGHLYPDSHREATTRLDEMLFGPPRPATGTSC